MIILELTATIPRAEMYTVDIGPTKNKTDQPSPIMHEA